MNWLYKFCVLTIYIGAAYTISNNFDCRRANHNCQNSGTCNETDGACVCPVNASSQPQFRGRNCGLTIANIADPTECSPPCLNGAECYKDTPTSAAACFCPDIYFGPQCETKRHKVTCSGDSMTVELTPFKPFTGLVFTSEDSDVACAFTDNAGTYTSTQTFTGPCTFVNTPDIPNTGDMVHVNTFIIQFSQLIEAKSDISVNGECLISGSGISNLNDNIGTIYVDQRANLTETSSRTTYQPVSMSLQLRNGDVINQPVFIGDTLRLFIPLSDTGKYNKLMVTSFVANNGLTGTEARATPLITDGCLTPDGETVIDGDGPELNMTGPSLAINFDAFRIKDSPGVNFDTIVRVCEPTDNSCDTPCVPRTRRRRRDVRLADNEVKLHESLFVFVPLKQNRSFVTEEIRNNDPVTPWPNTQSDSEKCLQSSEILVMVIVLVVAIVVLLCITLCLAVRFIKSRSQLKVMDGPNMPSGNNMARIPRPTF